LKSFLLATRCGFTYSPTNRSESPGAFIFLAYYQIVLTQHSLRPGGATVLPQAKWRVTVAGFAGTSDLNIG
jgi:hypothetical protein